MTIEARMTGRISLVTAATSCLIAIINILNLTFFFSTDWVSTLANPSVWVLLVIGIVFLAGRRFPLRYVQVAQTILFFLLSGPIVMSNVYSFFGMWFFILGLVLFYKYGFYHRLIVIKLVLIGGYFIPFFAAGILFAEGMEGSYLRITEYFVFLLACLAYLFFIFEEEVRDLLAANKQKDVEIAQKDAEIARLEPLSTLGERVAHVAHSFKNNLSLLGTAQFHLEQGGNTAKAVQKLEEFSRSMNERIDNILMVSRAGSDQSEEVFDAARVLAGLNQVYLTEPAFLQRAKVELEAKEPTPVVAVRWDFLLMVENILKNALEALTIKGGYGNIRVTLAGRVLTIANDGGAMALCHDCRNDCLKCTQYGRPGQTTKKGGSGHGLAQVFTTCRQYGWTCRIRTHEEWTLFEIGLAKPGA